MGEDVPAAPTAPGGLVALVTMGFAPSVVPELPELAVAPLSCWEAVEPAAGVVLGVVALCEELFCPDVWDGGVVALNPVPDVGGVVPLTTVGVVVMGDSDVAGPVLVVVVLF